MFSNPEHTLANIEHQRRRVIMLIDIIDVLQQRRLPLYKYHNLILLLQDLMRIYFCFNDTCRYCRTLAQEMSS